MPREIEMVVMLKVETARRYGGTGDHRREAQKPFQAHKDAHNALNTNDRM